MSTPHAGPHPTLPLAQARHDAGLRQEVRLIVTALPAMSGPTDASVLLELVKAAENLDAFMEKRSEGRKVGETESGSLALDKAYTNEHQPKVHTQNHIRYQ